MKSKLGWVVAAFVFAPAVFLGCTNEGTASVEGASVDHGAGGATTPVTGFGGAADDSAHVDAGESAGGVGPGSGGTSADTDSGAGGAVLGSGGVPGAGGAVELPDASRDGGDCDVVESAEPDEGANHTPALCVPVTYVSNPPSSGTHYPVWTEFKTYENEVPQGFWVHSLEHGAIVITYNCPEGCASEVAEAQAMIDSLPVDPLCYPTGGTSFRRVVMTPDSHLTTRFAASAWGFTLRAKCFDSALFRAFAITHYAHTAEDFCSPGGYVPTDYPSDCGS